MTTIQFVNMPVELDNLFRQTNPMEATMPVATPAFRVRTAGRPDRVSAPVTIKAIHFDEAAREIKAFGSDGKVRRCKVDRLPSLETGRALWKELQLLGKQQIPLTFIAAGGFSPDVWFYDVSAAA